MNFKSHSMSECDSSDQPVSNVVFVVAVVNFFFFFNFSDTTAQNYFKFCVDVPRVDPYQVCPNRGATLIL